MNRRIILSHCSSFRTITTRSKTGVNSVPILKSTTSDEGETAEQIRKKPFIASKCAVTPDPTRALFPWRHSVEPLPRLIPDSDKYNPHGPGWYISGVDAFLFDVLARRMIGLSWFDMLLGRRHWEEQVCKEFSWAFGKGVSGLVVNAFEVPRRKLEKADSIHSKAKGISIEFSLNDEEKEQTEVEQTEVEKTEVEQTEVKQAEKGEDKEEFPDSKEENTEDHDNEVLAKNMLEQHLLDLYTSARERGKGKMSIRLQTRPISAHLQSLVFIPVTREFMTKYPKLSFRRSFAINENESLGTFTSFKKGWKSTKKFIIMTDKGPVVRGTVIAQVLVHCKEIFWVKDLETGEVVQGDPIEEEKDVFHLVRFEMTSEKGQYAPIPGSWRITDWDDLLQGNIFF